MRAIRSRPPARRRGDQAERGQGLVEFALILPILTILVVAVAELGWIYMNINSLGYGSRQGARVGAALAQGDESLCPLDLQGDPTGVDVAVIGAIQRVLKTPDAGIDLDRITDVRIFKATSSGAETPGAVNVWTHLGPGAGPEVEPGPPPVHLDFSPSGGTAWYACERINEGDPADIESIGVTVNYEYEFLTPFGQVLDAISGGALSVTLSETTVMALNPTL